MEKKDIDKIKERVLAKLNEISISQKKRNDDNVISAIKSGKSGYNGIKTIVVFTAENPNSTPADGTYNKKANHSLLKMLKDAHYVFVPVLGFWGGKAEHSYAVINMNAEVASYYSGLFEQTSFVYTILVGDSITSRYYEKENTNLPYNEKTNPYVIKDKEDGYLDMKGESQMLTIVGKKFKYKIDFPTFRTVDEAICRNYEKELSKGKTSLFNNMSLVEEIDFTNRIGQAPAIHRKRLYKDILS